MLLAGALEMRKQVNLKYDQKKQQFCFLRDENRPKLAAKRSKSAPLFKKHAKNYSKYKKTETIKSRLGKLSTKNRATDCFFL